MSSRPWTLLSALGLTVGACAFVVLLSVDAGLAAAADSQVSVLGPRVVAVYPVRPSAAGVPLGFDSGILSRGDFEAVDDPAQVPDMVAAVPIAGFHLDVMTGSRHWSTDVLGSTADFPAVRGFAIASGRFYSDAEVRSGALVAVIGRTVASNLFIGSDPLGRLLVVNGRSYRVIGVLGPRGSSGSYDQDDVVTVPVTTAWAQLAGSGAGGPSVDQVLVEARSDTTTAAVSAEVSQLLLRRHGIKDPAKADFIVRGPSEIRRGLDSLGHLLGLFAAVVCTAAFGLGAYGIGAMMLVSVRERQTEIAVRRSVGATRRDIFTQLLIETVLIAAGSGLVGLLLSVAAVALLTVAFPTLPAPQLDLRQPLLALAPILLSGILAGAYPALLAARLAPGAALRRA